MRELQKKILSANSTICVEFAILEVRKFADVPFVELICGLPTFAFKTQQYFIAFFKGRWKRETMGEGTKC
jgi:hypothetical protein